MRARLRDMGCAWAAVVWLLLAGPTAGYAQGVDLAADGEDPVAIDAQGGIEWRRDDRLFIAQGPATATRGDLVIDAAELRAYYREGPDGNSEVYRLDAIGDVRITTPGRVATGGHAVYDVDEAVIVLKDGDPVTLTSGPDVITTRGQMEFWENRQLAVARGKGVGGAEAVQGEKRIRAEVLTAHFGPDEDGANSLRRVEAFDEVHIETATEEAFADRAAYNVPTGLARLTGSVKMTREGNEIQGCSADINLNTGVSRMNSCPDGATSATQAPQDGAAPAIGQDKSRVRGVLQPREEN